MKEFSDITDMYEFVEERLVYVDGPVEGILRSRSDGSLFACRCQELLGGLVFHWALVPVDSPSVEVSEAFKVLESVGGVDSTLWISILEDRRGSQATFVVVELPPEKYMFSSSWTS